jgi:metallophosphoesterase superfamily enzyme
LPTVSTGQRGHSRPSPSSRRTVASGMQSISVATWTLAVEAQSRCLVCPTANLLVAGIDVKNNPSGSLAHGIGACGRHRATLERRCALTMAPSEA